MTSTGRPVVDFNDWMRDQERRTIGQERRPAINTASDLLGPGIAPMAVFISDWNDDVTAFNGFFASDVGAINSPNPALAWIGYSLVDANGSGYQRVFSYSMVEGSTSRTFTSPDGTTRIYSAWGQAPLLSRSKNNVATISTSTSTPLAFGNEREVTLGFTDSADTVFTVVSAGVYQINASVEWATGTGTSVSRQTNLYVNGTQRLRSVAGIDVNVNNQTITLAGLWKFTAGDTFEIRVFHNEGVDRNVNAGFGSFLQAYRMGEA